MKFRFYEEPDGTQPVVEQLRDLKTARPDEFDAIFSVVESAKGLSYEAARENEYIKNIRGKVDVLKVWGKQSRILGFRDGPDFIAAHHVIKKQDELRNEDIEIASQRRQSHNERKQD